MPSKTQSILLGGVVAAVIAAIFSVLQIPVLSTCLGCLMYIAAGLVAVWHYTETHALTISGGTGAGMGAAAGAVAGLIGALIGFGLQAAGLVPSPAEVIDQLITSGQIPADQAETFQGFFNSPLYYVGVILFTLIIGAILGAIGGAIGASVFKRGGDTPGGGSTGDSTGGGPGGPREPTGGRPQSGSPQERATRPSDSAGTGDAGDTSSYRPTEEEGRSTRETEERPRREEESTPGQ
jgi:hypothetical protein